MDVTWKTLRDVRLGVPKEIFTAQATSTQGERDFSQAGHIRTALRV